MYIKFMYLIMVLLLLSLSCNASNATDEESELAIQEKTSKMINQSDEGLEVKVLEDGTEYMDLKGRFQMYSKIKIVDGKQVFVCDDNPEIDHEGHTHLSKQNKTKINRVAK